MKPGLSPDRTPCTLMAGKQVSSARSPPSHTMTVLFFACAALGACVLIVQIILGAFGIDHLPDLDAEIAEGLELLSVRALSAGVSFFGLGGYGALSAGLGAPLASVLAVLSGALALVATAFLTRQVLSMESDGSLHIERAVGSPATVYLRVPAADAGAGKVQLALQGRTVELLAVTREKEPLPTGTPVIVVSVVDSETVEVLPSSSIEEVLDGTL